MGGSYFEDLYAAEERARGRAMLFAALRARRGGSGRSPLLAALLGLLGGAR